MEINNEEELERIEFLKEQIIKSLQIKLDETSILNSSIILLYEITENNKELDDIEKMKSYGEDDNIQKFIFQEIPIPPQFSTESAAQEIRNICYNKIPIFVIAIDKKQVSYNKKMQNFAAQFRLQKVSELEDTTFILRIESYYNIDKSEYKVIDKTITHTNDLDTGNKKIFLPYFN